MAKLTLSVEGSVVARAKRYAARRGTSLSRLVEKFLALVSRTATRDVSELPPILARLRDEMKRASAHRNEPKGASANPAAYRRYLERKYR